MNVLLITADNHTLGIQTVANIIFKNLGDKPSLYFFPSNLELYPTEILERILTFLFNNIDKSEQTFIGFHINELSSKRVIQIALRIKNKINGKLIVGGTYASVKYSELSELFDYVVVGSGYGIINILKAEINNKSISNVIFSRKFDYFDPLFADSHILNNYGTIGINRYLPLKHAQYNHNHALSFISGYGCRNTCSFCEVSYLRKMHRENYRIVYSDPISTIDILLKEKDEKVDYIYFFDEDFLLKPTKWIEKFSNLYNKKINLPYFIFSTPQSIEKYINKLNILFDTQLDTVNMGIQSGNKNTLKVFNRRESRKEVLFSTQFLVNAYLKHYLKSPPMFDFIILNPLESKKEIMDTIELMKVITKPYYAVMHCMSFFYGTPFYNYCIKKQIISNDYKFRYDLHDFLSRISSNELNVNYNIEENLTWLYLNAILFSMRGFHYVKNKSYKMGNINKEILDRLISNSDSVSKEEVMDLIYKIKNPMKNSYYNWESNYIKKHKYDSIIN